MLRECPPKADGKRSARVSVPVDTNGLMNCGAPPYVFAPSLLFLLAFLGILAAGEVIKEAGSGKGLRGRFDHVFQAGCPVVRIADHEHALKVRMS